MVQRSPALEERPKKAVLTALINYFISKGHMGKQMDKLPFVCKVCFISHQHNNDIASPLRSHIVYPFCGLLEGVNI